VNGDSDDVRNVNKYDEYGRIDMMVFGDAKKVVEDMVKAVQVQFSEKNFVGFNGMAT
jgi:hypothetical protein